MQALKSLEEVWDTKLLRFSSFGKCNAYGTHPNSIYPKTHYTSATAIAMNSHTEPAKKTTRVMPTS